MPDFESARLGNQTTEKTDIAWLHTTAQRCLEKAGEIKNMLENQADRAFGYRGESAALDSLAKVGTVAEVTPLAETLSQLERMIDRVADQARRF